MGVSMMWSGLFRSVACMVVAIALSGCAHNAQPPQPPGARLTLSQFAGNPLSGPTTKPVDSTDPTAALDVDVRLVALQQDRAASFEPIGPHLRLITADHAGIPVLAAGQLTRASRWGEGDLVDATESRLKSGGLGPTAEMSTFKLAIPSNVTALVRAVEQQPIDAGPRSIEIYLNQSTIAGSGPKLELAIGIADVPPRITEPGEQSEDQAMQPAESVHELAVLESLEIKGPRSALILIPFAFADGKNKAMLVLIHAAPGKAGKDMAQALATCADNLKTSATEAANQGAAPMLGIADWPGFEAALSGIRTNASRRQSLVYMATQADADICEDFALVAEDRSLEALSNAILKQLAAGTLPRGTSSLSWALDAATLQYLSQLQSGNKLPPELLAVLLRHTGQVGDNAGSVGEVVKASGGKQDFQARITAENLVYLEDNSPAARVRAFDWLSTRGAAPAGYDPLAPPRQRQDALEKAYEAVAAKTIPQGGRP
jgi:hypothetical protein